jgi:death-on-curing protein
VTHPAFVWIDEADILTLHDRLLVFHGGAAGLRDPDLLQSAIARPRHLKAYGSGADVIDMATALTAGLIKNHPFVDGNKRTGFVAGILFIELNGYLFSATEDAAAEAVLALAAGTLDEARYTAFLRANTTAAPG